MVNLVIAFDDNDFELGSFFEDSFLHINNSIDTAKFSLIQISGHDCNHLNIVEKISPLNPNSFVFVGYSHGNEDELVASDDYVGRDFGLFINSFLYTTACCSASGLGPNLIQNGTRCFVGCTKNSCASNDDFHDVYILCENHCIREFLNSEKTIQQTFDEMKLLFDDKIDEMFNLGEIQVAMELLDNKDCMVALGNTLLTINDFVNN